MIEGEFKSKVVRELKLNAVPAVIIRHEDKSESGVPDMSVTYKGKTTWWEFKIARPKIDLSRGGIQRLVCARLSKQGHCRYVVLVEQGGKPKRTYVLTPGEIYLLNYDFTTLPDVGSFSAVLDVDFVVQCILGAHEP